MSPHRSCSGVTHSTELSELLVLPVPVLHFCTSFPTRTHPLRKLFLLGSP